MDEEKKNKPFQAEEAQVIAKDKDWMSPVLFLYCASYM